MIQDLHKNTFMCINYLIVIKMWKDVVGRMGLRILAVFCSGPLFSCPGLPARYQGWCQEAAKQRTHNCSWTGLAETCGAPDEDEMAMEDTESSPRTLILSFRSLLFTLELHMNCRLAQKVGNSGSTAAHRSSWLCTQALANSFMGQAAVFDSTFGLMASSHFGSRCFFYVSLDNWQKGCS